MTQRDPNMTEAELARCLRDEGVQSSPAFSELLHARVMRLLDQAAPARPTVHHHRRPWWLSAAAAVLLLAAAAWLVFQPGHGTTATGPSHEPVVMARPLSIPSVEDLLAPAHARLHQAMQKDPLARVDQDAKRLAGFLIERVSTAVPVSSTPADSPPAPKPQNDPTGRTQLPATPCADAQDA
jgi:hypothetical protein